MHPRRFLVIGLVLAAIAFGAAQPMWRRDPPPPEEPFLRQLVEAQTQVRFRGQRVGFVNLRDRRVEFRESVERRGMLVRLEHLDGALQGQVAVEDGQKRWVFFPGKNQIREMPARNDEVLRELGRNLGRRGMRGRRGPSLELADGGTIAGFPTRIATLRDGAGNPRVQLWVEPTSWVVLKRRTLSPKGETLAEFEFTQIEIGAEVADSRFDLTRTGALIVRPEEDLLRLSRELQLPPFTLEPIDSLMLSRVQAMGSGDTRVLEQLFTGTDGPVSLFTFRAKVDPDRLRKLAGDDLRAFAWSEDRTTFVLVGSQDTVTLRRLSNRVRPLPPPGSGGPPPSP